MEWIDYVIISGVGAAIIGIVVRLILQKKKGKGGCGCGGCPHASVCPSKRQDTLVKDETK